jgi:hypothetical protein
MTTLHVNLGPVRHVFETSRLSGALIEPKDSGTVNVEITNELILPRGSLAFHVIVKVPKTALKNDQEADPLATAWLKHELPARMSRSNYWSFFETTWVAPDETLSNLDSSPASRLDAEITLTTHMETVAEEACNHTAAIEQQFDSAKHQLTELAFNNTAYGFSRSLSEARKLIRTIEAILSASADVGGYKSMTARSALADYQELARRKVESNRNYQVALRSLQTFAFGVTFPKTWGRRPALHY